MPEFILHRNHILRTTKGFAIRFTKGKPVNVPPRCVEDAVAIGAVAVNPEDGDVLPPEETAEPALSPSEKKAKVFAAFEDMVAKNERADFMASGIPKTQRLGAVVGFEVNKKERDNYWREYQAQKQAEFAQAEMDHKADTES